MANLHLECPSCNEEFAVRFDIASKSSKAPPFWKSAEVFEPIREFFLTLEPGDHPFAGVYAKYREHVVDGVGRRDFSLAMQELGATTWRRTNTRGLTVPAAGGNPTSGQEVELPGQPADAGQLAEAAHAQSLESLFG